MSTVLVKTYPNKSMWYHEIKLYIITELYEKHYFKEINVISIYDFETHTLQKQSIS